MESFGRRPRAGLNAASILMVYASLLLLIPSRLVIGPLGGAATPAQVLGVAGIVWWAWDRLHRTERDPFPAARSATFAKLWALAVLTSFAIAIHRPLSALELSTANISLVALASWMGVYLLAYDGLSSIDQLRRCISWMVGLGSIIAALGIVQFATGQTFTEYIQIPGLTGNTQMFGTLTREGFVRPAGTSIHPIEFGAVLTMILPIAIYQAIVVTGPRRRIWLVPPAVIMLAIAISVSRSALVCAFVGIMFVIPTVPRPIRKLLVATILLLGTALFVLVPGLVGTIAGLFTTISNDPSTQSRTDSYSIAAQFIGNSPLFGRGMFTFLPTYRIFDNQYLLFLVEIGIMGTVLFVLTILSSAAGVFLAARRVGSISPRLTGYSLCAAIAAGAVSLALFDAFSFPMVPGLLFLLLGLAGAYMRLSSSNSWLLTTARAPIRDASSSTMKGGTDAR